MINGAANHKVKAAIIGSGNIGTDLMFKILRNPGHMELALLTGIDPKSEGLARARAMGVAVSDQGIEPILDDPSIRIVFDATSAYAHVRHAKALKEAGRVAVDLTPAGGADRGPLQGDRHSRYHHAGDAQGKRAAEVLAQSHSIGGPCG